MLNAVVVDRAVISQLDDDTVLFVLGDHGMTSSGDHGGDSVDELDATLFVYSSSVISSSLPPQVYMHFNINTCFVRFLIEVYSNAFVLESDRSHDEARYRLPDNYVTLKPITDADNRCLIFVNPNNEQR